MPLVLAEFFGLGIISAISYLPFLQSVFNTAPLTVYDWLMLTAFGLALFIAEELRKAYVRSRRNPQVAAPATRQIPLLQPQEA
jgi:P-type Ca2+ transporter type 2C